MADVPHGIESALEERRTTLRLAVLSTLFPLPIIVAAFMNVGLPWWAWALMAIPPTANAIRAWRAYARGARAIS